MDCLGLMQEKKSLQMFHRSDRRLSSQHLVTSKRGRTNLRQCRGNASGRPLLSPQGWLGVMAFLGVLLGLLYARLTHRRLSASSPTRRRHRIRSLVCRI